MIDDDTTILELYADCALKNQGKIECFKVLEEEKIVRFPKEK